MQLDIILRTHDQKSLHGRGVEFTKKQIVRRCATSLFTAIKGIPDINLIIVDDHSSEETLELLGSATLRLEDTGNNASMKKVFGLAADSKADVVYLVEDDYLHYPYAISEALETFSYFQLMTDKTDIALSLVDCPSNYHNKSYIGTNNGKGRDGTMSMIVGGIKRPWRTDNHTGGTFMTTPTVVNKYWGAFDTFATNWPYDDESTTINKIWGTHVPLFAPIVPLAYHIGEVHPYFPCDQLWRESHGWSLINTNIEEMMGG